MSEVRASGVASLAFVDLPSSTARPTQATRRLTARLPGKEGWCLLVGLLLLWQLVAWVVPARNRFLFPSPLLTVQALWASLPELGKGTLSSFIILIPGYAAAVVAGVGAEQLGDGEHDEGHGQAHGHAREDVGQGRREDHTAQVFDLGQAQHACVVA